MSTSVAERPADLVTKDPPPCELLIMRKQCGRPSAYRLKRKCECGANSVRWVCEPCYFDLITGAVYCNFCLRPVIDWVLALD